MSKNATSGKHTFWAAPRRAGSWAWTSWWKRCQLPAPSRIKSRCRRSVQGRGRTRPLTLCYDEPVLLRTSFFFFFRPQTGFSFFVFFFRKRGFFTGVSRASSISRLSIFAQAARPARPFGMLCLLSLSSNVFMLRARAVCTSWMTARKAQAESDLQICSRFLFLCPSRVAYTNQVTPIHFANYKLSILTMHDMGANENSPKKHQVPLA